MANTNTVFGARFVRDLLGFSTSGSLIPVAFVSGDATAAFVGDFVTLTGEAVSINTYQYNIDYNSDYIPVVAQAAAAGVIAGVVESFLVDPNGLNTIYRTASTNRVALIRVNPYSVFTIQSSGTGAAADVGQCADITVAAGSTVTGLSGMQLDHTTLSGTDGQLKIVGVSKGSEVGAYTKFDVIINENFYKQVAGV